jgi:hypothetical protein
MTRQNFFKFECLAVLIVAATRINSWPKVKEMERREECTVCWWGNLRERGHWGDSDIDGRIILRSIFGKL